MKLLLLLAFLFGDTMQMYIIQYMYREGSD